MDTLRQQLLNDELKRIELLAEANSIAVMNKADALLAAYNLCQVVNQAEPGVCEFRPYVHYDEPRGGHCAIRIHTHENGGVFLRRLATAGLKFEVEGFAFEGHQSITVDGFKGVTIIIRTEFLAQRRNHRRRGRRMSSVTHIIPDEATLLDVAEQACAEHLHIISNGKRTALSPVVPKGWHRLVVMIRTPTNATLRAAP